MNEKQKCSARVSGEGRWGAFHQHPCRKAAKVERDGKLYCGTHDPVAAKARDEKTRARWQEKWDEDMRRTRLRDSAPKLLEALKLVDLHFQRNLASDNFQGDDEHEAWNAVRNAIKSAKGETL
jgi:uncharacterized Zn finger protein (UPF0148 family)